MNSTEKNLSLWQLTKEHQELLSQLYDLETGEVNEIIDAKLRSLCATEEQKCIAVTQWIKKLESDKHQLDFMLEEIKNRISAYEKTINKHKSDLMFNMESRGINRISCPLFTVKLIKNPYSTDIINEKEIPQEFMKDKVTVTIKPDKNMIKERVLKTGVQVPGAHVSQKNKIEIDINHI